MKVNSLEISRENFDSDEKWKAAISAAIDLLGSLGYSIVIEFEEYKNCWITYNWSRWSERYDEDEGRFPVWLTPTEFELIYRYRKGD